MRLRGCEDAGLLKRQQDQAAAAVELIVTAATRLAAMSPVATAGAVEAIMASLVEDGVGVGWTASAW